MNILILANHYAVASGRYAADAFRRLGHQVWTDGPAKGRQIWGHVLPPWTVWNPRPLPMGAPAPDLVVVMDSDPLILDLAERYKSLSRVVVWGVDNHVRDYRRPWFDHYFLAHLYSSVMKWEGEMTWLPCAYDPSLFGPGKPWLEREIDVALLGVLYPHRRQAIQELRSAGLVVVAGCGLIGEAQAEVYKNAKLTLSLSAAGDLGQRVFEAAACGSAVFSDAVPDLGLIGLGGVAVWSGDNLTETVEGILQDVTRTPQMAALCQSQVLSGHSWDDRAITLLGVLESD